MRDFNKTAIQYKAIELMTQKQECLLEGGSRSGKTFIEIYAMIARGLKYPETRHLCVRKHFNHAKVSLWAQTIPAVFKIAYPAAKVKYNNSDFYATFGDGSSLWIAGTDDKERIEKILGTEWATILLNEISEQPYATYEMLKTRLNPPQGMRALYLMDQNPPKSSHWSNVKFHKLLNPETNAKLPQNQIDIQGFLKMNPMDNIENLNESYINTLETLSEAKKRRFLFGEYGDDTEGALWKSDWINKYRITAKPDKIIRVVVAIDPNVTDDKKANATTDDAGIVTVGKYKIGAETHYCVIRDDSTPGLSWGSVACEVFKAEKADRVIGEVNQGGDLIEMNLRNYDRNIAYSSVRATRGKEVRAEPIADLYRRGFVHHIGELPELENELTTWVPGEGRSPNRLDALVWGLSELSGIMEGRQIQVAGV